MAKLQQKTQSLVDEYLQDKARGNLKVNPLMYILNEYYQGEY